MSDVAPLAFDAMVHAITAFGLGGLVGGLVATWWHRRAERRAG
jgi:predicted MFS family arabinose efflux permease